MANRLSEAMDFDHPVRVDTDGTVTDEGLENVHAPELMDETIYSDEWEFFSTGYTGQYGYNGPILHNSEQIGGGLERDILASPGVYVAVVAQWTAEEGAGDDGSSTSIEGWAVLKLIEKDGEHIE